MAPHIVCVDLELAPNLAWVWGAYEQNALHFEKEFELMSFAYQWRGQRKVHVKARCDYNDDTDKALATDLWALFDKADIIIGHNIDRFDVKKANSRFLQHKLGVPSHFRTIDTLKIYRKHFSDNKNGLDHICKKHGLGSKTEAKYGDLWLNCIQGEKKAWRLMKKYNAEDVRINMKLYDFLLPWIDNHPNMSVMLGKRCCPNCASEQAISDGFRWAQGTQYRRLQCKDCGTRYKETLSKRGNAKISGK